MEVAEKAYCEVKFFQDVIKHRKEGGAYSLLYKFLRNQCNIYLDIDKPSFEKKKEEDNIFRTLWKRENLTFKASSKWQDKIDFGNNIDQVYFVDSKTKNECRQIREQFGCLIISNDDNDLSFFERLGKPYPFHLVPIKERLNDRNIRYFNSWDDFFNSFKFPPLNAVVITDNYMLGAKFQDRKNKSLYAILKALAPKELKQDFHITLFVENGNGQFKKEEAEQTIKEIKELNLCKDVKVSIIAHTVKLTTHDRKIITNYGYMNSGVGFGVINENGICEVAQGQEQSLVCAIDAPISIRMLQVEQIQWLKDIFDGKKGMGTPNTYVVGDKINRLFS